MNMDRLTTEEIHVVYMAGALFDAIVKLGDHHPSDLKETERDIHCVQNRIMARLAKRAHRNEFRQADAVPE